MIPRCAHCGGSMVSSYHYSYRDAVLVCILCGRSPETPYDALPLAKIDPPVRNDRLPDPDRGPGRPRRGGTPDEWWEASG